MDCLLGSLLCMARGPSEHGALQKAWGLWDVWLCWRQLVYWMGLLTFVLAWLKVESVVRKRQYELRAQFMRLCGHQSMMSDAHRAGANLLQNQINFFLNITQKIELCFFKKKTQRIQIFSFWPKELNLFSTWLKELNPSFSTWLTEIELFLQHWLIEIELTFWTWLKELNHFSFKKYNSKYWTHFTIWLKELNPFFHLSQWIGLFFWTYSKNWTNFFEYDSKNWTLFFLLCDSKNFNTIFEYDSQSFFFSNDLKNWTLLENVTRRI